MSSYGEFIQKLRESGSDGRLFVEQWIEDIGGEGILAEHAHLTLNMEAVLNFARDMTFYYRGRLGKISSDALFNSTLKEGKEFLTEIQKVAEELGVEIPAPLSTMPITITEMMVSRGYARVISDGQQDFIVP